MLVGLNVSLMGQCFAAIYPAKVAPGPISLYQYSFRRARNKGNNVSVRPDTRTDIPGKWVATTPRLRVQTQVRGHPSTEGQCYDGKDRDYLPQQGKVKAFYLAVVPTR